jgi:nucleotide-binding universal stress UspA family protein
MVHHAPCSVLVARKSRSEFPSLLVHADDGSPESLDAARLAGRLAAEHDSSVVTLHVSETADGDISEEAVGLLEAAGREPVVRVEGGSPHRVIIETANELKASMIVMGSRGRTGLAALGSVSERVAHRADCSVLIVRQASYPAPEE